MHIQVRNCCIITLTNLPLQVKKTGEKKRSFSQTHPAEPGGGCVKELKDSTCKALILIVCSPINVPGKVNWEGQLENSTSWKCFQAKHCKPIHSASLGLASAPNFGISIGEARKNLAKEDTLGAGLKQINRLRY